MEQPISRKLQHELGLAVIKRTVTQRNDTNSRDPKMVASFRAEENWRGCSFLHAGQQWSQRQHHKKISKAGNGRGQRGTGNVPAEQTVNLNTAPTAMNFKLGKLPPVRQQ